MIDDVGLSNERTGLSWQRTALSAAAVSVALFFAALRQLEAPFALFAALPAALAALYAGIHAAHLYHRRSVEATGDVALSYGAVLPGAVVLTSVMAIGVVTGVV